MQEAKEVQKDLTAKMNKGTTLAENLEKKNATATSLDKSLGEGIEDCEFQRRLEKLEA